MKEQLEKSGFTKIDGTEQWFINFQGRTYYTFEERDKWWISINKNGFDIYINQVGFTTFDQIKDLLNAVSLGGLYI